MSIKQKILYFLSSVVIMLLLAAFDIFVMRHVVDMLSTNWLVHFILFVVAILLINPFIGIYIVNKLPFKVKGLKDINELKTQIKP